MIRNRDNQILHQADIEIKDGIMYLTACIKQYKERAKRTAFSLIRNKRTHNRSPALERLVIKQWVGLGLNKFHSCTSASPACLQAKS